MKIGREPEMEDIVGYDEGIDKNEKIYEIGKLENLFSANKTETNTTKSNLDNNRILIKQSIFKIIDDEESNLSKRQKKLLKKLASGKCVDLKKLTKITRNPYSFIRELNDRLEKNIKIIGIKACRLRNKKAFYRVFLHS